MHTSCKGDIITHCSDITFGEAKVRLNIPEHRVCMGPGKPWKSWNFIVAFSRTGKLKSWKKATCPGKLCLADSKEN